MCAECYDMGYSEDVKIPGDGADSGYGMTNGYSGEYVVSAAVSDGVNMPSSQYHNELSVEHSSSQAAVLAYPSHYAPATPMLTTMPYCTPLVADPYIVQHGAVSYPTHQVTSLRAAGVEQLCKELSRADG